MLSFLKRKSDEPKADNTVEHQDIAKPNLFARLKKGLAKTRSSLGDGVANLVLGKKTIDNALLEDLETILLTADVGVQATQAVISDLTARLQRNQLQDSTTLIQALKTDLVQMLQPCQQSLSLEKHVAPVVILMVGINGAGKTTTIGKLAKHYQIAGKKIMLAAGDTFRAAAVEQLQVWGDRNDVPVVAQSSGADSAAVIFDALQAAKARQFDILIADTAGRLHTKDNLMEELKKIKRVLSKIDADAPQEILLVLDAGIGQNALQQVRQFHQAVGVTGIVLTKLDGTAKGGVIFAIAKELQIPIRYIGVGEQIDDLRPFNAEEFVEALFGESEES